MAGLRCRVRYPLKWLHLTPLIAAAIIMCAALTAIEMRSATTASSQSQPEFAHPAFQATWERTDRLIASGEVKRPWVWGPFPGRSLSEPLTGLPGNAHLVQYFDKGRMEINNPTGNVNDPFFVTNGLLSVELISGLMQTGLNTFENRGPAVIDLASDADDPTAPTYQSFNGVSSIPGAPNNRRKDAQIGQLVRTAIDRQGITQPWPAANPDYGVRIAYYEPLTGHNIPDIFWNYLNQQTDTYQNGKRVPGPLFNPWFSVSGYPISEPYWSYVKVEGRYTDVLIQAFERRILTFAPYLPSPFKVQMGNIGMHYFEWRYLPGRSGLNPGAATPTAVSLPPLAKVTIDDIVYRDVAADLNGNYATLTNRGQAAQSLDGWWLDSPKWSHVDHFYFPNGIVIQPGASIDVHSGVGNNTSTDIYMARTSPMWDAELYDLAVLYDRYGREVSRFFPASDVGPPPPVPPVGTTVPRPTSPLSTVTAGVPGTPGAATATKSIPTPVNTAVGTIGATTPTGSPAAGGTATTTRTRTATATPTP